MSEGFCLEIYRDRKMTEGKKNPRPTIGFLIDTIDTSYHLSILHAVNDAIREKGANLICFQGGFIADVQDYYSLMNKVFDFVSRNYLDGIIILGTTLFRTADKSKIMNFFKKFKDLPVVNIGWSIEGIPGVEIDNKAGMKKLINHLILHHHYRKLAFIKGREGVVESEERLEAYLEALRENRIKIDESVILPGNFLTTSGIEAVRILLDEQKLQPDAIIASNDYMAMGAIEELARRGIQVPFNMAVTGFDNIDLSLYSMPPITTISQPYRKIGSAAADLLFGMIEKKEVPQTVVLNTELIIRDSCSYLCSSKSLGPGSAGLETADAGINSLMDYLKSANPLIRDQKNVRPFVKKIIKVFMSSIEKKNPDIFFKLMNKMAGDNVFENNNTIDFYSLITGLRNIVLPPLDPEQKKTGEYICFNSLMIFARKIAKNQILVYDELSTFQQTLNSFQQDLYTTLKTRDQIRILERRLPELGIKSGFLSLFSGNSNLSIKPVMAYNENGIINMAKTAEIPIKYNPIPAALLIPDQRYTYIIELLAGIGIIGMEMVSIEKRLIYRNLREYLGIAFNSSKLFSELQEQKNQLNTNLKELRMAMEGYLQTMASILETRDPYTAGHQRRVADLARSIAAEMGLPKEQKECIRMAGIVHDIGKIRIPAEILNKPTKLSAVEFELIKNHPSLAYNVLQNINFPWPLAEVVYQHHERINGSGYPRGLTGDQMRIESKILCVADVIEAMASYRPYRPALGISKALEEIARNKGVLYDSTAVEACLRLFKEKGYKFIDNK